VLILAAVRRSATTVQRFAVPPLVANLNVGTITGAPKKFAQFLSLRTV